MLLPILQVHLADWKGHLLVLNTLVNPQHRSDFLHGFEMLAAFQDSRFVTQVLGHCQESFVTEYHKLGSAQGVDDVLKVLDAGQHNTIEVRLSLCIGYVEILNFLHRSPLGIRVMCDSNDLQKTLAQYLLRSNLELLVNDLDALPETNESSGLLIKCGHRRIYGEFPAPEQLWPYDDRDFDEADIPPYDEKTDIWKIPDVCDYFLGDVEGSDAVRFHLFAIHKKCKEESPCQRPNADEVLLKYIHVRDELGL